MIYLFDVDVFCEWYQPFCLSDWLTDRPTNQLANPMMVNISSQTKNLPVTWDGQMTEGSQHSSLLIH